ncbi:hypothetical protein BS78_05G100400 [Paspalum vaginatum]|nr:hypothetical protein BS78_05G100400 [Paspalum vaginatum]
MVATQRARDEAARSTHGSEVEDERLCGGAGMETGGLVFRAGPRSLFRLASVVPRRRRRSGKSRGAGRSSGGGLRCRARGRWQQPTWQAPRLDLAAAVLPVVVGGGAQGKGAAPNRPCPSRPSRTTARSRQPPSLSPSPAWPRATVALARPAWPRAAVALAPRPPGPAPPSPLTPALCASPHAAFSASAALRRAVRGPRLRRGASVSGSGDPDPDPPSAAPRLRLGSSPPRLPRRSPLARLARCRRGPRPPPSAPRRTPPPVCPRIFAAPSAGRGSAQAPPSPAPGIPTPTRRPPLRASGPPWLARRMLVPAWPPPWLPAVRAWRLWPSAAAPVRTRGPRWSGGALPQRAAARPGLWLCLRGSA